MPILTIEAVKKLRIPKNTRVEKDNAQEARGSAPLPNDSISIYDAIVSTIDYLGISTSANTDLTTSNTASTFTILSSTGTDAVITAATTSAAGVMTATDKTNLSALLALDGVADGATNLGTFTGSIIPDNTTIKSALQSLESAVGLIGVPPQRDLLSGNSLLTVTNGVNSVINNDVTLTVNAANINIAALSGTLNLSQISTSGAVSGDVITFNGTNWVSDPVPSAAHNSLSGIQGGVTNEYYHLRSSLYNVLTAAGTDTLIGRDAASSGDVTNITLAGSLTFTGSNSIQLTNDASSPGASKYYGTNASSTKGFFSLPTYVSSLTSVDSSNIDINITSPTTTPIITADLIATGVIAGTYGNATSIPQITVDANGRLTSATTVALSLSAGSVSGLDEAIDDRVNSLLVAGTNITLTYNDPANTLTINSTAGGVSGTGGPLEVAYWNLTGTAITSTPSFLFDGTGMSINTPSVPLNVILTTKGLTTGASSWGYQHLDAVDNIVFSVDDNGTLYVGDVSGTPLTISNGGILKAGSFYLSASTGDIDITTVSGLVHIDSDVRIDLGSDATGDIFTRNSSGNLQRIAAGTSGYVLTSNGTGMLPTWQAAGGGGGSLPGGTTGDILVHDGTDYQSVSRVVETQTGITGTAVTLASTPLTYTEFTLYKNGLYQIVTDDFSRSGASITMVASLTTIDRITAIYYL